MLTKVQKCGNGLGVRIPRAIAQGIEAGMHVDVMIQDGRMVITPRQRPLYNLATLVSQITPNVHAEIGAGQPADREIW